MATTYGKNIRLSIYGGSHDDHIGVIAEGLPQGYQAFGDPDFSGRYYSLSGRSRSGT